MKVSLTYMSMYTSPRASVSTDGFGIMTFELVEALDSDAVVVVDIRAWQASLSQSSTAGEKNGILFTSESSFAVSFKLVPVANHRRLLVDLNNSPILGAINVGYSQVDKRLVPALQVKGSIKGLEVRMIAGVRNKATSEGDVYMVRRWIEYFLRCYVQCRRIDAILSDFRVADIYDWQHDNQDYDDENDQVQPPEPRAVTGKLMAKRATRWGGGDI